MIDSLEISMQSNGFNVRLVLAHVLYKRQNPQPSPFPPAAHQKLSYLKTDKPIEIKNTIWLIL